MSNRIDNKTLLAASIVGAVCGGFSFMLMASSGANGILPSIAVFSFSVMFGGLAGRSIFHVGAGATGYGLGLVALSMLTSADLIPIADTHHL